jgi:hypothetical protein
MPTLRSSLQALAQSFADQVLAAIRSANLEELLDAQGRVGRVARGGTTAGNATAKPAGRTKSGRLPRRTSEEIAVALEGIVGLLKKKSDGMRAEAIRVELGMQAKEMPRVLKQGLVSKKLKAKAPR